MNTWTCAGASRRSRIRSRSPAPPKSRRRRIALIGSSRSSISSTDAAMAPTSGTRSWPLHSVSRRRHSARRSRQALAADLVEDPGVVGVGVRGGAEVGRVPLELVDAGRSAPGPRRPAGSPPRRRRPRRGAARRAGATISVKRSRSSGSAGAAASANSPPARRPAPSVSTTRPARRHRLEPVLDQVLGVDQLAVGGVQLALALLQAEPPAPRLLQPARRARRSARSSAWSSSSEPRISARALLELGDPPVAAVDVEVVEARGGHGVVRRPALLQDAAPAGRARSPRRRSRRAAARARASSASISAIASSLEKPMMLRVSLRPWVPRRPLRVCPARVTRKPGPARPSADSTQSALRAGSSTWACTQPENGESLKSSLPATRSGSAGPRSGRSSSTPSNVSRPRSRSPSMAAEKSSSRSSGTSIIRALRAEHGLDRRAPRAPPRARRRPARPRTAAPRRCSPLARATSARSSCIRAGIRPARFSSDARSRRSSPCRSLSGNWRRSTASRSRRIRSWLALPAGEPLARRAAGGAANASADISADSTSGAPASD